ncbi:transposase, partial [Neolewinella litorea]
MRRYEITDEQWAAIAHLFPVRPAGARGRPSRDHRTMLNGILWVLFSGAAWRDIPARFGSWQTVYDRFRRWSKDGTFDAVLDELQW